jgi:two-component system NtrC family sensor kinase
MKLLSRRLAHKLILSLIAVATIIAIISSYVFVRTQESQVLSVMIRGADQLSGAITSATWHAMLDDRRDAAYQQMEVIATKQGIDQIRIFNKEGRVMFSAGGGQLGPVDKGAMTCKLCHSSERPLVNVDVRGRARIFHASDGSRKLGIVTPIYNEAACSQAACHAHPEDQRVLGVLDVTMNLEPMDRLLGRLELVMLLITLLHVVLMSVVIVVITRRFVDRPIRKLIGATRAVAAMRLNEPIELRSSEELDELARSFNSMRGQLEQAIAVNNEFTRDLEQKVEERTAQLEVAHRKLLQSDRLASLGQLSASVAHEINNPVAGVLNLSMLMDRIVGESGIPPQRVAEFKHYLGQVTAETARVGRIVSDLLAFSRRSRPQSANADLNALVRSTLAILSHKLALVNVETETRLDESLPLIRCDGSQIQQVILNLVMNGAEATASRGSGRVTVTTRQGPDEFVLLEVSDDGDGIPSAVLPRIFDPFFTTKGEGKGVGLGLAVVYGILEAHGGGVDVESREGRGTTFTVTLPLSGSPAGPVAAPAAPETVR